MKPQEFDILTPFQKAVIKLLEQILHEVRSIDPLEDK